MAKIDKVPSEGEQSEELTKIMKEMEALKAYQDSQTALHTTCPNSCKTHLKINRNKVLTNGAIDI